MDDWRTDEKQEEQEGFMIYVIRFFDAMFTKKETGTELSFFGFVMLSLIICPSILFFHDEILNGMAYFLGIALFFFLVVFFWRWICVMTGAIFSIFRR